MIEILRLSVSECRLLAERYQDHGNSHRRMASALRESGEEDTLRRLRLLRGIERRFAVDLGSLCHKFEHRNDSGTHPIERMVLSYVASWRRGSDGKKELLVYVDRVRQVRALIDQGRTVHEPE